MLEFKMEIREKMFASFDNLQFRSIRIKPIIGPWYTSNCYHGITATSGPVKIEAVVKRG